MTPRKPPSPPKPSALEWICAGLSLLLIAAVIAVLGVHAMKGPESPADLSVRALDARQTATGWTLDIEVSNSGDRTASAVTVEGAVGDETATANLDYVAGDGRREATLRFQSDPRAADLRVTGWVEP